MADISQTTLANPIFLNENIRISIKISLNFVSKVPINNIPALVQIMAWRIYWRIYEWLGLNKLMIN